MVDEFSYLGSVITSSGRMTVEVDERVAQASKAFGALRKAVFIDKHLKISTKRIICNVCVCLCCVVEQNVGSFSESRRSGTPFTIDALEVSWAFPTGNNGLSTSQWQKLGGGEMRRLHLRK